jgi:hypothetical protein
MARLREQWWTVRSCDRSGGQLDNGYKRLNEEEFERYASR